MTEPNPIDVFVGKRLRYLRGLKNISQVDLGNALGVSFQQVQKYESGFNRVSASKLYEAAQCLGVTVADFFDGVSAATETGEISASEANIWAFARTQEGQTLAQHFSQLRPATRRGVVSMVRAILTDQEE